MIWLGPIFGKHELAIWSNADISLSKAPILFTLTTWVDHAQRDQLPAPRPGRLRLPRLLRRHAGMTRGKRLAELAVEGKVQLKHVDRGLAENSQIAARDEFVDGGGDARLADPARVSHARSLPPCRGRADVGIEAAALGGD